MYFKLNESQELDLLRQPETGMGYQIIDAKPTGKNNNERFIVLNSQIAIELNGYESNHIRDIINKGIYSIKAQASLLSLSSYSVLNESQFHNSLSQSKKDTEKGATEGKIEYADGEEIFVRLSAFDDDRRVDKVNKCLRPGSFTTTMDDYILCKSRNLDPVDRYALPNEDKIKYAFHIRPFKIDTLQRGIVQPANGKQGGGKEVYFANGTSPLSFLKQTDY